MSGVVGRFAWLACLALASAGGCRNGDAAREERAPGETGFTDPDGAKREASGPGRNESRNRREPNAAPQRSASPPHELGWPLPLVDVAAGGRGEVLSLQARADDLVLSVAPGIVTAVGIDPRLGRTVSIEHDAALVARYGGLGEVLVHEGLSVERGTAIGVPAMRGSSTLPVKLELRVHGRAVDPLDLLGLPPHDVPTLAAPLPEAPAPSGASDP